MNTETESAWRRVARRQATLLASAGNATTPATTPKDITKDITMIRSARTSRLIPVAATLWLASAAFAQGSPAGGDEAMNAIQSNFARMTPSPRTVDSINQELRQNHAAPMGASGRGGGRGRGRQRSQDSTQNGTAGTTAATPPASQDPGLHANAPSTAGATAPASQ
ncbi:hypothetical protein [Cupriavidus sp. CuC1]|uniref:hypothetical protein n=1 Tax=Cupriavidus sp. CuC1 TaxID=3373131 RepID=UPI0037D25731